MKQGYYIALSCLLVGFSLSTDANSQIIRTVALSGDPAPGTSGGAVYGDLSVAPVLNSAGNTAFVGSLIGSQVDPSNVHGIWSEGSGSLELVARGGERAPGTPDGVNFSEFSPPYLSSLGQTAFIGMLTGNGVSSTNAKGIWSEGSGLVELVARTGEPAHDSPDEVFYRDFENIALNSAGHTTFRAFLLGSGVGGDSDQGIWLEGASGVKLVARTGGQAAGAPSGAKYAILPFGPVLNATGQTAFYGYLAGGDVALNTQGVWFGDSDGLDLIAISGQPAAGMPDGVVFGGVSSPLINSAGQIVFEAGVTRDGVDGAINAGKGIWTGSSHGLRLVVRQGDPAPGTPDGSVFRYFTRPLINSHGQSAFVGLIQGGGIDGYYNAGVWSECSGSLSSVARETEQAPGTPDGTVFAAFNNPVLNSSGDLAFVAMLRGEEVDSSNDRGIWAEDRLGNLRLIVREGNHIEVAPGDFRRVEFFSFWGESGNEDGRRSGFNDIGQLAFRAQFTDGSSGIFVSNLVAIPEPSSATLLVFGFMATLCGILRPPSFCVVRKQTRQGAYSGRERG